MADKINMSLDDIIKLKDTKKDVKKGAGNGQKPGPSNHKNNNNNNKKGGNQARGAAGARARGGRKVLPAKNARVVMANKVLKRSKAIIARAGARRPAAPAAGLSTVATKKLVNKLVKNALRKRTNITTAQVVRKRGGVAATTLAARRNQAIRRAVVQPIVTSQVQRPVIRHVRPAPQPTRIVREIITAPPVEVIRRAPPPVRRNRVQQQQPRQQQRTVIVRQVQPQGGRFRQNNRRNEQPTVIRRQVVQQAPRRVQVVRPQYQEVVQRVVRRAPPQQIQRVQRVQPVQQNVRYVNAPIQRQVQRQSQRQQQRPQQRRNVVQQVQYQPVQYVTERVVTSRGRGFRAY